MAVSFTSSLSLSSPISPLLFRPNSLSSPNSIFFIKSPFITITNAKAKRTESSSTFTSIEEEEEEEEEDADEDEDEEFLAFEEMRRWEMKKPSGFGEGKVYDTTTEERILEEMEKERMAKIAADNKKKMEESLSKKKEQHEKKALEFIPSVPTVRLANLPKKRNIHRDLQIAFKGFDGIVNITPVVSGNWKTREPICKGLAFVELVSEKAANRFVNTYSKQDILFGKVQKQISFEYINAEQSVNSTRTLDQPNLANSGDETLQKEFIGVPIVEESEEIEMEIKQLNISPLGDDNENESHENGLNQKQMPSKRKVIKKKSAKSAKLSLPSSMKRLKIKERNVLTGVFSKYGGGKIATGSD